MYTVGKYLLTYLADNVSSHHVDSIVIYWPTSLCNSVVPLTNADSRESECRACTNNIAVLHFERQEILLVEIFLKSILYVNLLIGLRNV